MTDSLFDPTMVTFYCCRCGHKLGLYPETAGVAALCTQCWVDPYPPIHPGWRESSHG